MDAKTTGTTVIAVGNQKGGVGKTTTTVNLAAALGTLGKRSLVIDLDANCGATHCFKIPPDSYQGSYELLLGEEDDPLALALETDPDEGISLPLGVSMIPGSRDLENAERALMGKHRMDNYRTCLREPIRKIRESGRFDFVFLDTAPNIMAPTASAYWAADWFILTATPERLAIEGMNDAMSDIRTMQEQSNPNLKLLGVALVSVHNRTKVASEITGWVEDAFSGLNQYGVFDTRISRATAVPNGQVEGKTIFEFAPTHKVAEEFRQLAREVLTRIDSDPTAAVGGSASPVEAGSEVQPKPDEGVTAHA